MAKVSNLKDFKLLKESKVLHEEPIFVKDLILGSHPIALKLLKNLSDNTKEEVKLIHEFEFADSFILAAPRLLRGEKNYQYFRENFPQIEIEDAHLISKFYKDGEKREFGGRVKPHEIKEEEKFFCVKPYLFDEKKFYGDWSEYEHLKDRHVKAYIKMITPLKLEEIASREHYSIELTDGRIYRCENLYVTFSPVKLAEYLNKDKLDLVPNNLFSYAKNLKSHPSLSVKMKLKGEWEKDLSTLFIPQSQTHEWGSFITEFDAYDSSSDTQAVNVLCYLTENEIADNEEIAKKIRLMKRVLDRVYENFEKRVLSENISFSTDFLCSNCEDSVVYGGENSGSMPHLKVIHVAGPIASRADLDAFSSTARMLAAFLN